MSALLANVQHTTQIIIIPFLCKNSSLFIVVKENLDLHGFQ